MKMSNTREGGFLEISGIPGNVHVNPSNIAYCYRLKSANSTPQKVLVKLSKRKDVYRVLKSNLALKMLTLMESKPPATPIFFNQSLCRYDKKCSKYMKLWLNKVAESFWVSKGSCRIKLLGKSVKVITHIDDLKILFLGNSILEEISGNS